MQDRFQFHFQTASFQSPSLIRILYLHNYQKYSLKPQVIVMCVQSLFILCHLIMYYNSIMLANRILCRFGCGWFVHKLHSKLVCIRWLLNNLYRVILLSEEHYILDTISLRVFVCSLCLEAEFFVIFDIVIDTVNSLRTTDLLCSSLDAYRYWTSEYSDRGPEKHTGEIISSSYKSYAWIVWFYVWVHSG